MAFDARASVDAGLHHLSIRLDPVISSRLGSSLSGLPWTVVLSELDRMRGRTPRDYSRGDLQAQLKMLTERLGKLGYPFDDHTRMVSALGSELRVVRNRWAHHDELNALDAWRTHDFVVRLLERLDDGPGIASAVSLRDAALDALASERSGSDMAKGADSGVVLVETGDPAMQAEAEVIRPDPGVLRRSSSDAQTPTIGADRGEFEAWTVVLVGGMDVLDDLPKKVAKEQVRAVAAEIVQFEGPIHMDRLAQLTAASFGVRRLFTARAKKLIYQIRQTDVVVDPHGFVWPSDLDATTWTEFRPNDSTADRPFSHVSPIELTNAMRFLKTRDPSLGGSSLDVAVLQTFGRKRRTKLISAHLALAYEVDQSR